MTDFDPPDAPAPAPALDFVTAITIAVGPPHEVGATPHGIRRVIPILGGRFDGPLLAGEVVPGGADWQLVRADGVAEIEARYTLRTRDGALIDILNTGLRHGPPEVMADLAAGRPVDPSLYYFRSVPRFETAAPALHWLHRTLFLGTGVRRPDRVVIAVFAVR